MNINIERLFAGACTSLLFTSVLHAGNDIELISGDLETNVNSTYGSNSSIHQTTDDSAQLGVDNLFPLGFNTITTTSSGTNSQLGNITVNSDISFNGVGDSRASNTSDRLTLNALNDIVINNKIYDGLGSNDGIYLYLNPDSDADTSGSVLLNSSIGDGLSTIIFGQLNIGSTGSYNLIDSADRLTVDSIDNTAGGSFNFTNGSLTLNASGLVVDTAELLGDTVSLSSTKNLQLNNNNIISIGATGSLSVDGGSLIAGQIDNTSGGAFNFNSGFLQLTNGGVAIESGGLLGTNLILDSTKVLSVSAAISIGASGSVDIVSGGTLYATSINNSAGGSFTYTGGRLTLTNSGLTVDGAGLLGNNVSLGSTTYLTVSDAVTIGSTGVLSINGGSLDAASIDNTAGGSVSFTSGDLTLRNSGLNVGASGLLGSNLSLLNGNTQLRLENNNVLTIDSTGSVVLDGGYLRAGDVINNSGGDFNFLSGTLHMTNAGVSVDESGMFGNALTIESGKNLYAQQVSVGNGASATDIVTQTGGSLRAFNGLSVLSGGEYNISGGEIATGTNQDIIISGDMNQNGGLVYGTDNLIIASGGTYVLNDGLLDVNFIDRQAGGTFTYNGGTFDTNNDIVIDASGLLGATLDVTAGKTVRLSDMTINNAGSVTVNGGNLSISGALTKNTGGAFSFISGNLDLGSTTLSMSGAGLIGSSATLNSGDSLFASTINMGGGSIVVNSGGSLSANNMTSSGGLVTLNGGSLFVYQNATIAGSNGLLGNNVNLSSGSVGVGGVLTVDSGASLTMNGGRVDAGSINAIGNFAFIAGNLGLRDNVTIGAGGLLGQNVILDGSQQLTVNIYGEQSNTGTVTIESGSKLTLNDSAKLDTDVLVNNNVLDMNGNSTLLADKVTNTGNVNIGTNSTMNVYNTSGSGNAEYIQQSGNTVVNGDLFVDGVVSIESGKISGSGALNADLVIGADGQLLPGNSPGALTINGDLDMLIGSILNLEIQSDGTGGYLFDELFVSGVYDLQGQIRFSLLEGVDENIFASDFDMSDFFKDASGVGITDLSVFDTTEILAANGENWFAIDFDAETGAFLSTPTTSPVPVPAAAWLFGSGLIGLIGVARRKKS